MASVSSNADKDTQGDTIGMLLESSGLSLTEIMSVISSPRLFVEKFLKNPLDGKPFVCNVIQSRMMDSLENKIPKTVTNGHRRSGKSAAAQFLVIYLMMTRASTNILFVAPFNNQIEAFFTELDKIIDFHPWLKNCVSTASKNPYRKTFKNGCILRGITTGSKSKSAAGSARGQTAQYVFLDEVAYMSDADFATLKPIIEGDVYHAKPITFATSTPFAAIGQFFKWCTEEDNGWLKIYLPITQNPDRTPEQVAEIRKDVTERQWQTEYLCEFLNSGGTVFNLKFLKSCQNPELTYNDFTLSSALSGIIPMPEKEPDPLIPDRMKKVYYRTMGVDWDKYNKDGSGPTIVILDCDERTSIPQDQLDRGFTGNGKLRVVLRLSVPQSEYVFIETVNRIKDLNRLYNPDRIWLDAGAGEMQYEYLKQEGVNHPVTGLLQKIYKQQFGANIAIQNPLGGTTDKYFKNFMVNLLAKWIEDEFLEYPESDKTLYEQFSEYVVRGHTVNGRETYSNENEHIIDACGLAAVAMFQIHSSPFRHAATQASVALPPQKIVPGELMTDYEMKALRLRNPTTALLVTRDRDKNSSRLGSQDASPQRTNRQTGASTAFMTRRKRGSF